MAMVTALVPKRAFCGDPRKWASVPREGEKCLAPRYKIPACSFLMSSPGSMPLTAACAQPQHSPEMGSPPAFNCLQLGRT